MDIAATGLNEGQPAELHELLLATQLEVERSVSTSYTDARPVDLELAIGRVSRVDALQQQHMALARKRSAELRLQQVRGALARIVAGSYGDCARCGEPIGYARLKVRPEAALCRACQAGGEG